MVFSPGVKTIRLGEGVREERYGEAGYFSVRLHQQDQV